MIFIEDKGGVCGSIRLLSRVVEKVEDAIAKNKSSPDLDCRIRRLERDATRRGHGHTLSMYRCKSGYVFELFNDKSGQRVFQITIDTNSYGEQVALSVWQNKSAVNDDAINALQKLAYEMFELIPVHIEAAFLDW